MRPTPIGPGMVLSCFGLPLDGLLSRRRGVFLQIGPAFSRCVSYVLASFRTEDPLLGCLLRGRCRLDRRSRGRRNDCLDSAQSSNRSDGIVNADFPIFKLFNYGIEICLPATV